VGLKNVQNLQIFTIFISFAEILKEQFIKFEHKYAVSLSIQGNWTQLFIT